MPGQKVKISTPHRTLDGYLSTPSANSKVPGIVVIHDIFGMTNDARRQADWLADSRYVAIAPDLFSGGLPVACLVNTFRDLLSGAGQTFDDLEATRKFLLERPECNGKVGILGFCMGGSFALAGASKRGFDVASANYGRLPKDFAQTLKGACPIVGSYGGADEPLKGVAETLEKTLTACGVEHDVKEYPGVGHCFMNQHEGAVGWLVERFGMGYNEQATADARQRILSFFAKQLGT